MAAFLLCLVYEFMELLVPVLEVFQAEAAPLGLEVNWQKTMVQALGSTKDEPASLRAVSYTHLTLPTNREV